MSWANKIRQDRPAAPQDYCAAGVLEDRASDTDGALCASGFLADQNEALVLAVTVAVDTMTHPRK